MPDVTHSALQRLARIVGRTAARDSAAQPVGAEHSIDSAEPAEPGEYAFPEPPLTVKEVGNYLGVGDDVVRDLLNRTKLKGVKIGGRWRVFRHDLAEYLIDQMQGR